MFKYICDGRTVDEKAAERFCDTFEIAWITRSVDNIIRITSFWNCIKGDSSGNNKISMRQFLQQGG